MGKQEETRRSAEARGRVRMDDGSSVPWREVADGVRRYRALARDLEKRLVVVARAEGASWDRISLLMGGEPTGETLRRWYAHQLEDPAGRRRHRQGSSS